MKRHKQNTGNATKSFVKARAEIRNHGNIRTGLSYYKSSGDPSEFSETIPQFLANPTYKLLIWSQPFPKDVSTLTRPGLVNQATFKRELTWTVQVLLPFTKQISEFLVMRADFERELLRGDRNKIDKILNEIQSQFGLSFWLIESRINYLQAYEDGKSVETYTRDLIADPKLHPLLKYLIIWLEFRANENISRTQFHRHLDREIPLSGGVSYLAHLLLGGCPTISSKTAAAMLAYADIFAVVDRYLMTVSILNLLMASDVEYDDLDIIVRATIPISQQSFDPSLRKLFVAAGGTLPASNQSPDENLYNLYLQGSYQDCLSLAEKVLADNPTVPALCHFARSAQRMNKSTVTPTGLTPDSLAHRLFIDLRKLLYFSEDGIDVWPRLHKLAVVFNNCAWASELQLVLHRCQHDERISRRRRRQSFHSYKTSRETAEWLFCLDPNGGHRLLDFLENPSSVTPSREFVLRSTGYNLECSTLSAEMLALAQAIWGMRNSAPLESEKILTPLYSNATMTNAHGEFGLLLCEAKLSAAHFTDCADTCVQLFQASSVFSLLLPIKVLLKGITKKYDDSETPDPTIYGQLPVVICFDIYSRFLSSEFDEMRTDAFKDFLTAEKVQRASQLKSCIGRFPKNYIVYFFKNVCIPEVLDQSLALDSTRAVEDERSNILVLLSELTAEENKPPSPEFLDELQTIKTRQIVRDTTFQLDQSKIFVNVEGIKKAIGSQMRENWQRYKLLTLQEGSLRDYEELKKVIQAKLGERITFVSLTLPTTERNRLFAGIFAEIGKMFTTSKEFGLDANLSTNIRHGFVLREIRGPLLTHHLVTNKPSEESEYQPNLFWAERFEETEQYISEAVQEALSNFSAAIDSEIEHLNRKLLRIKSDQATEGLFDFAISSVNLQLLQQKLEGVATYEEFIDGIFDFLWDLTRVGLQRVRDVLPGSTLARLNNTIHSLQSRLRDIGDNEQISALLAATYLARTDVAPAIERVASWFTISATTEYQDYPLSIAYEAALATVKSYYSQLEIGSDFRSNVQITMSGWTLPFFARLFSLLLENSAYHAGINHGRLPLSVEAHYEGDILTLIVKNALSTDKDFAYVEERIANINANFGSAPSQEVIQQEGGSGYPKIWKILAHDLGGEHALVVSLTPGKEFLVEIVIDAARFVP